MEKVIEKMDFDTGYTSNDGVHWVHHPSRVDILKKINEIVDVVNSIAEPRKHGRWVAMNDDGRGYADEFGCTNCSCVVKYGYFTKGCDYERCPYCGAKMDEVDNG